MGFYNDEDIRGYMEEVQEANARMLIPVLEGMKDSQLIAYLALVVDNDPKNSNVVGKYMAARLDKIALMLTAYEILEGEDNDL